MTDALSANAQAILLLTAPMIAGRGAASPGLLSHGEYNRLARHLHELRRSPADLVSAGADECLRDCHAVIDRARLQRLLGRGFLLGQVIERWQARAIWVLSRADVAYPRRLKARLREQAPPVLYGCGNRALAEAGGIAVVGSGGDDRGEIEFATTVGRQAAAAGKVVISGGGSAMHGSLAAGGKACGVLTDNLEQAAMTRDNRNALIADQLVLISPADPMAGINAGNAAHRNALIHALADVVLVVAADPGSAEPIDQHRSAPVYMRSTGAPSTGLDALHSMGALPWPNPQDATAFAALFDAPAPPADFG
jgi:predicted Rossmann fold nucleotide-binding protein DprA/Smf involved in DNA uptake